MGNMSVRDPETGYFATTNLIMLPPQASITRAEFAKLFVEGAKIEIYDGGVPYFEDIKEDHEYYSYIQTLYNLGLLDLNSTEFDPDGEINRAEALRIVLDYFDVDLKISPGAPHFEDVTEDDLYYPYVESLVSSSKGSVLEDYFNLFKKCFNNQ